MTFASIRGQSDFYETWHFLTPTIRIKRQSKKSFMNFFKLQDLDSKRPKNTCEVLF